MWRGARLRGHAPSPIRPPFPDFTESVRSVSHVAVLPADRQAAVLDDVRAVLRNDPATARQAVLALPYRVDAYWAERC